MPRKAVRRAVRKNNFASSKPAPAPTPAPTEPDNGIAVRLDNAEDAEFRYIGNNKAAILKRFPSDIAEHIKQENLVARAQDYLPDQSRLVHKWHDKQLAGVMKAWDAMDAVLNPVGNYEVHAISFVRDVEKPATDDNIGWFISWNTPV